MDDFSKLVNKNLELISNFLFIILFIGIILLGLFIAITRAITKDKNKEIPLDKPNKVIILYDKDGKEYNAIHLEGIKYELYELGRE
jgi:hypothetical protein